MSDTVRPAVAQQEKCLTLFAVALWVILGVPAASALEERVEDLSVSVEVAGVFGVEIDQPQVAFNNVSPGTTTIAGEGRDVHELRCRSNAGRPWYLKAHLLSLRHAQTGTDLPAASLQWNIVDSTGSGEPAGGRGQFHPFAEQPVLVYASAGDDQRGREVLLRFQYSLTVPPAAPAGDYLGQLVFTMADTP